MDLLLIKKWIIMNARLSSKTPAPLTVFFTMLISITLVVGTIFISTTLYNKVKFLNDKWIFLQTETTIKQRLAEELNTSFNDKGLLGSIKRYVYSPNKTDERHIIAELRSTKELLKKYKLIQHLSTSETSNLLSIDRELNELSNTYYLMIALIAQNKPQEHIINKLTVKQGQQALKQLLLINAEQLKSQNSQYEEAVQYIIWLIIGSLSLIPLVLYYLWFYWISRHKVTSDILAASNRNELEKIYKYSAIPTFIVNRSGDIVSANMSACNLSGYSKNLLLSKHVEQLISQDEPDFFKQIMTLDSFDNTKAILNLITNKNENEKIRVEIEIAQIMENSNLLSIVSLRDVEDAQKSLDRYDAEKEMHKFTEATTNVGSWRWNFANDELIWSEQTISFYGFDIDTHVTQEFILSRIPHHEREKVSNAINESVTYGKNLDMTHHIKNKNGELVSIHQYGHVVSDNNGKPLYMLGTVTLA